MREPKEGKLFSFTVSLPHEGHFNPSGACSHPIKRSPISALLEIICVS